MTPEGLAMWAVEWIRSQDRKRGTVKCGATLDAFDLKNLFVELTEKARELRAAVFDEAIEIISRQGATKCKKQKPLDGH